VYKHLVKAPSAAYQRARNLPRDENKTQRWIEFDSLVL